jgi:hypothetical protein
MGAVAIAIPIDTFQLASNRVGLAVTVTEVGERLAAVNRRLGTVGWFDMGHCLKLAHL